jgi:hypothetical protein
VEWSHDSPGAAVLNGPPGIYNVGVEALMHSFNERGRAAFHPPYFGHYCINQPATGLFLRAGRRDSNSWPMRELAARRRRIVCTHTARYLAFRKTVCDALCREVQLGNELGCMESSRQPNIFDSLCTM